MMKRLSNIFRVFLALSLVVAVSYCCCIKEALAKSNHACCAQKTSQSSHSKDHTCPKVLSSFADQTLNIKSTGTPEVAIALTFQPVQKLHHPTYIQQLVFQNSSSISSEVPLYIAHHNFRI